MPGKAFRLLCSRLLAWSLDLELPRNARLRFFDLVFHPRSVAAPLIQGAESAVRELGGRQQLGSSYRG